MSMSRLVERPHFYVARFLNAGLVANATVLGPEIHLDSDAPFRMTGLAVYVFDSTGTALAAAGNVGVSLRFTRPDRTWIQKHLISAQALNPFDAGALNGAGGQTAPYFSYFSPLGTNILYPASSSIQLDFTPLAGVVDVTVLVVFIGTKLFQPGAVWAPTYPNPFTARPYFGYSVQIDTTALPILNVPLNIAGDADFVWQCGSQTDQPPAPGLTPVGIQKGIGIRLRDWSGKAYMNDFVPLELIFGFDNSQTPGLIYPEIYIPKNQGMYMDLSRF